ncbi:MAG TPA: phosphotransferase [Pseudonocardiaceae bacterium]|nr:phosphotransferase [Pseudonocardiaceae bacterium]
MMSHPVALAPDPAVPQRDHLLDPDDIARRLSARLGVNGSVDIRSCRLGSICYQPNRRLRVVYELRIDGRDVHVAAGTFPSRSRSERAFWEATDAARHSGPVRPVVYDTGLDTVFWTFPNDRKLLNLPAAVEARKDLTRLVDRRWASSLLVDYNAESSAVVRCLDDSHRIVAYAKVHPGDEGERTLRVHSALSNLARESGPRIARPLAYSEQHRTLMVEPIEGTSIRSLTGTELAAGLHAYGAALAKLHSLPPDSVGTGGRDELERLRRRADGVRMVLPDMADDISELLDELAVRWADAHEPSVPIHGDTNENNAILEGDHIALIDFDRACVGAAASDVGNFLSLLRFFRALGLLTPADERARADAFTRGYASVRPLPAEDCLRMHESAGLAERAFRAVIRLRGSVLPRIPALLAEARGLLR